MNGIKNMLKDALVLCGITLVAGAVLGTVYQVTKEPIAVQKEKAKQAACKEVFEEAASFTVIEPTPPSQKEWETQGYMAIAIDEVMVAQDAAGAELGYILTVTTAQGYASDIQFAMGVKKDGTLNGISILTIKETAGLGMEAEDVLQPQFKDKQVEIFEYTKVKAMADNQIEAISSATVTTEAFVNGVNAGLYYVNILLEKGGGSNE